MLKIEEGKYYKTRDGRKVGPLVRGFYGYFVDIITGTHFSRSGRCGYEGTTQMPNRHLDLIAEWTDGPVVTETVTKTRIVPGVYDGVSVQEVAENDRGEKCADIGFELAGLVTADELDAAAAVLSTLAKGLRDA